MPETAEDKNIVETLRTKTEQEDVRQYLKSTWGGYTKASVQEYLNLLRRQQQMTAETFSRNQQVLFEEKEKLKKNNESLTARLERMETEYRNLTESLRCHELDMAEGAPSDIAAIKSNITVLEDQLDRSAQEKSRLEQQLEQQKSIIEDYILKLEQSGQEKLSVREMLKAEMLESKKQRSAVLRLAAELDEKNDELELLKAMVSEGQLAILREKIADLTRQLETQSEFLCGCNEENSTQSEEIEVLRGECETLRQTVTGLTNHLEDLCARNDSLLLANQSLSDQLEKEYKRSIALIQEKSHLTADKLLAVRKLEEAGSKTALLELKLQKYESEKHTEEIYKSADRAEEIKSDVSS